MGDKMEFAADKSEKINNGLSYLRDVKKQVKQNLQTKVRSYMGKELPDPKNIAKDLKKELNQIRSDFKKAALDAKNEVKTYRRQFEVKVNDIKDEAQKLALEQFEKTQIKPVADALLQRANFLKAEFEKNPLEALKNLKTLLSQSLEGSSVKKKATKGAKKTRKPSAKSAKAKKSK